MKLRFIFGLSLCLATMLSFAGYQYKTHIMLEPLFQGALEQHGFPGGCVQAGTKNKMLLSKCYGYYTYARKYKDHKYSLFDIASLTKVVATTTAVMQLYDQGKIKLNDKVCKFLPKFCKGNDQQAKMKSQITILELLAHTSGLPAGKDIADMQHASIKQRFNALLQTHLIHKPSTTYTYSDINFILLGKIVEKISGQPLNVYVAKHIFKPLGMNSTFYLPSPKLKMRIVPTEYYPNSHKLMQGVVDDPTARALGGVSGNAGLFTTIGDLGKFAEMMLNMGSYHGRQIVKASTIELFTKRANLLKMNSRALGWDTVYNTNIDTPPEQFTAGKYVNPNAYGHTGYTGTSIWISKKYGLYVILLTNRVTPPSNDSAEKYFRQAINSAIWRNLGFTQQNRTVQMPVPNS